jgi:hypothetical protein
MGSICCSRDAKSEDIQTITKRQNPQVTLRQNNYHDEEWVPNLDNEVSAISSRLGDP